MMKSLHSENVTLNYREHFKYINDFSRFYTSLPISLYPENSPVVMKDMCKSRKYMPTTIIAPDGYVPNSPVRVKLIPLGKKEFSDENANKILSSIVSTNNDLLTVNVLNKLPDIMSNMKTEEIDDSGREAGTMSKQSCRNMNKDDFINEQTTIHLVKAFKLNQSDKRQTTSQYFEKKMQGDIDVNGMNRKILAESENQQETTRVEDNNLIDYLRRNNQKTTLKKKRRLKDDNSLKKLNEDKIKKNILSGTIEQSKHSNIKHNKLNTLHTMSKCSKDDIVQTELKSVEITDNIENGGFKNVTENIIEFDKTENFRSKPSTEETSKGNQIHKQCNKRSGGLIVNHELRATETGRTPEITIGGTREKRKQHNDLKSEELHLKKERKVANKDNELDENPLVKQGVPVETVEKETIQVEGETFQPNTLIRYTADFEDPDELVKLEAISLASMNQDEYLRKLVKMSWYPYRSRMMNKETIAKHLLKHLDNIHDWNNLRQAEISIITLQKLHVQLSEVFNFLLHYYRLYKLNDQCKKHIQNYAEQHFLKWYHFVKERQNIRQEIKEDAFVQALSALTILSNFNVNVDDQIKKLKNAFTSVNKLQETVKRNNQFHMNNLTSKDTTKQDNLNTSRLCKILDIMFQLDEVFQESRADEPDKMQQNEMELQTNGLIKFNKWRQTNRNKMPDEILKIIGSSSFKEKDVRLHKYSIEAFSKVKTSDKAEKFDENIESFESSRDKLTSHSIHIESDALENNKIKTYLIGQQLRLSTRKKTPQGRTEMKEFLSNPKEVLAKQVKELPKAPFQSLSLKSLELNYHDSERSTKNGDTEMLKRNTMANETTKMLISRKNSLNKQRTSKKEEVNVIKAQHFTKYKENLMNNRQHLPKSTAINLTNSIINKPCFVKDSLTSISEQSLFETALLTKSGPLNRELFPLTSVQTLPKIRELRKQENLGRTPSFTNLVMNFMYKKSKQFKRQNSKFNFSVETLYELSSLHNKAKQEKKKVEVNKMNRTNGLTYRKQTLETPKIQMEPSLTITSLPKIGSILTIQSTSSIISRPAYKVIQQKPHKTQKKAIKPSENPSDTDIRDFDFNFDTQNFLQRFVKVLESNIIPSCKQEGLVPTLKLEKDNISALKPLCEIYWGSSDVNQGILKQPHCGLMFKQKLLMELINSLSIERKQLKNEKPSTLPMINILKQNISYQISTSKSMNKKQEDLPADNVNDLCRIIHHSQDKLSPKELTNLLAEIKIDHQKASNTVNLMYECNGRTYEGSKAFHVDSDKHKISVERANLLRIESHTCQPVLGKFHCRYEALARKRYQNLGLSISNHITRMNLIEECMHKPTQQRTNQRICGSIRQREYLFVDFH
ncbi:unnamed protein product [Schistosoma rodhaini]|uniref:Uncharacterized protein n=1 Tax=Schistosoma rodhaini TaxID=6188 RepID=A0AA85F714_9TREM|nr:unnamed protein product [Schistosoma rodhaini]